VLDAVLTDTALPLTLPTDNAFFDVTADTNPALQVDGTNSFQFNNPLSTNVYAEPFQILTLSNNLPNQFGPGLMYSTSSLADGHTIAIGILSSLCRRLQRSQHRLQRTSPFWAEMSDSIISNILVTCVPNTLNVTIYSCTLPGSLYSVTLNQAVFLQVQAICQQNNIGFCATTVTTTAANAEYRKTEKNFIVELRLWKRQPQRLRRTRVW